eukprot:CAMPEP_0197323870 /NCGR_PEP_ID=MMETSP0891-20130614/70778_1 /TAXON_ID=44058 ORGANISM="Aureoumbra lagunensis, Strain CCMP1510" /NCGR_SAMPLE_ID=MMETSP0891 /ASSEMBLY_ACC=CAM_ASM_000534 /LENGTH=994 /DNA_ID=CAMNT_0042816601 /DNA_START=348 /DNA_END=3332 /DNA_ORIENTATION=-
MSKQKPSSKSRRTERRADIAQVTMYQNQRRGEGGPLDADDLSPQFGGISQVRRPRSASSTGNEVTQIINNIPRPPIVPLPPPIPPPLIIDASSKALETILPSSKTDSWQPNTSLSNSRILDARPAQTYTSASPGKDARYDACRFARDLCNYICIPHNATAASFYYFHFFMAHGVLEPEPPSTVLDAIMAAQVFLESKLKKIMDKKDFEQKNTHWFTLLSNGEFVDENDTSPIPVGLLRASAEVYMGALPPDELCALAVAAVYLGAKSCDVPHRISTLLEAARRSAIKRKWPPALPWRDHILLAEHRLLKALNFDLRVDDAKVLLEQICPDTPTAECYLYANESKGTQNISTLDMPPPDQPPKNPKCLDPRLKEDTIEKVIYTPAFEASGIVLEHEPKELIAASVFCVWNYISKNLSPAKKSADTIIKDAWLNSIFPVKQTTASPTKKRLMNPNEIKIKGIIGELDATNSDLRIRFSAEAIRTRFEERYDAISIRKARYDTALRAANNAKARLADDEIGRFVVRRCQDHIPPSTKPIAKKQLTSDQLHNNIPVDLSNRAVAESLIENPIATRRRRDDECGVLLYIGDDPSLIGMARRNGFILNLLVFPFRCDDAHFRRLVFETSEKNLYQPPRIENMGNKIVVPAVEPEFGGDDDDGATEERASSLPRHFVPILHIFWPLADIEALKLSRRAMEDVKNRTRDLANSLRAEYDSLRAENKVHFENTASTQVAKVQVDKSDSVVIMKSPNGNKTNGDSHSTSLRMETSSLPSLSNSVPNEADTRAVSSNTGEQRNRSDSNGWNGRHFSQRDDYRSRPSQEMSNNYARHYDARNNAYDQSRGRQSTNTPPDFEARRRSLSRDYRPESNSHLGYYRGDQPVYSNDRAYRPDNHVLHRTDRAPYYRRDMPYHSSPRDDQGRGYRQGMPYRSSPRDDQRRGYRQDMPYHSPPRDDQHKACHIVHHLVMINDVDTDKTSHIIHHLVMINNVDRVCTLVHLIP